MNANELLFKDEAFAIVGAAMEVHSLLGPGFLEGVYGDALAIEFTQRGIPFQRELDIPISYKGQTLPHSYRADFLVYNQILVELKAIKYLGNTNELKRSTISKPPISNWPCFSILEAPNSIGSVSSTLLKIHSRSFASFAVTHENLRTS